jgi:hypothetical protein
MSVATLPAEALPAVLSLREVAAIAHVTPETIRKWVRLKKWPQPDTPGKKALWLSSTVLRALAGGRKAVTA